MRLPTEQAGEVSYADVDHKGGGIVHFGNKEDMEYALRKLDGSEFSNRYDSATIQVRLWSRRLLSGEKAWVVRGHVERVSIICAG